MAHVESNPPTFAELESEKIILHRPISWLAVVAVVATLFSLLAFAFTVLWLLPLVSAFLSVVALVSIARSSLRPYGRKAAIASLAVSLFVLGCAPARYFTKQQLAIRNSREHAEMWLQLVIDDKMFEAHQLTRSYSSRAPRGTDLSVYYREAPERKMTDTMRAMMTISPRAELEGFLSGKAVKRLQTFGPDAKIRFVEVLEAAPPTNDGRTVVKLKYDIEQPKDDGVEKASMTIVMERKDEFSDGLVVWRVVSLE